MDVEELIENAKGPMFASVLCKSLDGFTPPGVMEWSPGKAPVEYLRKEEQPHYVSVDFGRAFKVRAPEGVDLTQESRISLDEIQDGTLYEGSTGYLSADDPYTNISLITDQRIFFLVGKRDRDRTMELEFDEEGFTIHPQKNSIFVNEVRYTVHFWDSGREISHLEDLSSFNIQTSRRKRT